MQRQDGYKGHTKATVYDETTYFLKKKMFQVTSENRTMERLGYHILSTPSCPILSLAGYTIHKIVYKFEKPQSSYNF